MRGILRDFFQITGKSERKVAAVFACEDAVAYVRRGAPEMPIWYFGLTPPPADTAALCERLFVEPDPARLLSLAQKELWSVTVALSVASWEGTRGAWPVKLAPFLIPPFRTLFRNEHGDYFPGTPSRLVAHLRERVKSGLFGGGRKVIAVFACEEGVRYVRKEAPGIPVWYFGSEHPSPETAAFCERVCVEPDAVALIARARGQLRPMRVGLCITAWHGTRVPWTLKLGPLLVQPFRTLIHNENGDLFAVTPVAVARHLSRRARDAAHSAATRVRDWNHGLRQFLFRALPLASASVLTKWFGFAFRYAFARYHGAEALSVAVSTLRGEGITIFRYRHRQWFCADLERIIEASTDRWILLLEGDAEASATDLLPPFEDSRTFAVSRQPAYRNWRAEIFPTSPFRTLQPGEFSQTLAPVSEAILVDRSKLSALGLPRTLAPGTALMMLFWKAAAAGWRSYGMGGTRELEPSPHWPFEDAEFIARTLFDPRTRALGPHEPDLARGSIAQDRLPHPPRPGHPRVLVVSPYLPYPLSHGGAVRIYNLCRALSGEVDFLLACFHEKGDHVHYEKLHEVFREVYVVDKDERAGRGETLPEQVREHESLSMNALITALCRERRVDILQIEYTHMARFREAAPQVPSILVEHDLTFSLYRQYALNDPSSARTAEYERWLAFERRCFQDYGSIWTMSEEDRLRAIGEGSPGGTTACVPNGTDIARFVPCDEPTAAPEVLYVGSFRHRPNVIGFEKVFQEVMPRVWERFPDARLRVVGGPDHTKYWREISHPLIDVHGFVEDLRPLYARAAVVVVPLLVSAGTNIKVMEAMAAGKPVVSTPVGCTGLGLQDGHDIMIRSDFTAFADAVCALLADPPARAAIAGNARRTVEQRFSWQAISRSAYQSYEQLAGAHAR
ncbi:MAG: glycosyltransferase [Bryobacterales bacterium]|nr:glycosyltransferase [Bryobacterales bacterium]